MLLVSFICFCPTDEWTLVLACDKVNLIFSFRLHICAYLLLYAHPRLLHLKVAQVLYSMHVLCFHVYTRCLVTSMFTGQVYTQLWCSEFSHSGLKYTLQFFPSQKKKREPSRKPPRWWNLHFTSSKTQGGWSVPLQAQMWHRERYLIYDFSNKKKTGMCRYGYLQCCRHLLFI